MQAKSSTDEAKAKQKKRREKRRDLLNATVIKGAKRLGSLCRRGHGSAEDPKKTWRSVKGGACLKCAKLHPPSQLSLEKKRARAREQTVRMREQVAPAAKFLGRLCLRGHGSAEDPEKSLRYVKGGTCCACTLMKASTPEAKARASQWRKREDVRQKKNLKACTPEARRYQREKRKNDEYRAKAAAYMRTPQQQELRRKWKENNRDRVRETRNDRRRRRLAEDENYRIESNLRRRLCKAMAHFTATGKVMSASEYGIDFAAIIRHLGPCPGDRADYVIDHIEPLCSFDLTKPEEVRRAFAPENHRWLTWADNMAKAAKERRSFFKAKQSSHVS